jgi:hypothetical protein
MISYKKALNKIHITEENGLVFCDRTEQDIFPGEIYHIKEKAEKIGAVAVLFRRRYDNNEKITDSKPVIYIFENLKISGEEHKKLHAQIWSAGDIDVYFNITKTQIDIFNARKPAEVQGEELFIENLMLVSETLEKFEDQRFSAYTFGKGLFWEQEEFFDEKKDINFFRNQLKEENTPYYQLLEHLLAVRKDFHNRKAELALEKDTIDKLLIICILVRYLEEIRDDLGKHTLHDIYRAHNVENFAEALQQRKCLSVLKNLAKEFNGHIFDNFSDTERQKIEKTNLGLIADFLNANLDISRRQFFLWQQYSFNYLPIELISSIYENFLPGEKGIVYTPPFLVNFMIDEAMPLNMSEEYFPQNQYKVLDPSCGSGVFLVAAYKRMLQWWSINEYKKTGAMKFPGKTDCQKILEDNIYGVDIEGTATLITIFSLTIALLDKLEPKEIWNNLRLKNLQSNIQTENFFHWVNSFDNSKEKNFDLVIGNPPFNPKSGIKKSNAVSDAQLQKFDISLKEIPNNDYALKFFEVAMFIGKKICLILPSNIFLYNKSRIAQKYRNHVFSMFTVDKIFDFTHLREILFIKKNLRGIDNKRKKIGRKPVCAVIAYSSASSGKPIEHFVIKRISSVENKMVFEIDHYDRHVVPFDWATDIKKQFVWKTNLLGGGRLFHLIYRFSLLDKFGTFLQKKARESNWVYCNGYIGQYGDKSQNSQADFLNGKMQIKPKSFNEFGIFVKDEIPSNAYFWNTRKKELYEPPHIIFKLVAEKSKIPMAFSDEYLCFNSSFVGIHSPDKDKNELYEIYERINLNKYFSKLYQAFILASSSKTLVYHETSMTKDDIDDLPYPDDSKFLITSATEEILINDILSYYKHIGKSTKEGDDGYCLHNKVSQEQLKNFGTTLCSAVNLIHAQNDMCWQIGDVFESSEKTFIIYQFMYGLKKGNDSFQIKTFTHDDSMLNKILIKNNTNTSAVFSRVTRIYESTVNYDYLFLIKPSATRYWLNSIALRDADDTIWDYYETGY